MSKSIIPLNSEEYNKVVTVIYSDDSLIPGDEEYKERKKMKLGDALSEIDNSKQYSFCECEHDIRDHDASDDVIKRLAGKCNSCQCKEYKFSGVVKTDKELKLQKERQNVGDTFDK
jgi:hypothetical protein